MSMKTRSLSSALSAQMMLIASAALLGRSAAVNTNFNYDDAGLLHANDGTDTTNTGGQDNGGTPQSDSAETGGQQQEQSNDGGTPQVDSTKTDTAAGKVDTDESVDGRQPE